MQQPKKKKQEEKPDFRGSTDAGSREANTDGLKVIKYYGGKAIDAVKNFVSPKESKPNGRDYPLSPTPEARFQRGPKI
jgi:hypothetical protein